MKEIEIKNEKTELINRSNLFFTDRNGNIYPYYKEDILNAIDPFVPATFLPFLEEMDYPFFEEEWFYILLHCLRKGSTTANVFGRYISKMKLRGFRCFGFKDSRYNKNIKEYELTIKKNLIFK